MQDPISNQADGTGPPSDDGFYKFLENEIAFQRTRKQEIFAWTSSLLIAIIGGVIALTAINRVTLGLRQKLILTGAVLILCGFAWRWIEVHWGEYLRARNKLSYYYDQISQISESGKDSPWPHDYTTIIAILALTAVALFAVWVPVCPGQGQDSSCHCCMPASPDDSGNIKAH